jgi:hypothetical protein
MDDQVIGEEGAEIESYAWRLVCSGLLVQARHVCLQTAAVGDAHAPRSAYRLAVRLNGAGGDADGTVL